MVNYEYQPRIVVPGGGSGCITIEDALFKYTKNIVAITPSTDNGGHSGEIRTTKGVLPPGDVTQRMAIRFRENGKGDSIANSDLNVPDVAQEFFRRRDSISGKRVSNDILATLEEITGKQSTAIKVMEALLNGGYCGRVINITDTDAHLRMKYADGKVVIGEEYLDKKDANRANITDIDFVSAKPDDNGKYHKIIPVINPEAVEELLKAEAIVIPPGSWEGSIKAVTEVPGFYEAVGRSQAHLFMFTNAVDYKGRTASSYLKEITEKIGRPIDTAVINQPNFDSPETYKEEGLYPVIADKSECEKYAKVVHNPEIAHIYNVLNKRTHKIEPTIRHDGILAVEYILKALNYKQSLSARPQPV